MKKTKIALLCAATGFAFMFAGCGGQDEPGAGGAGNSEAQAITALPAELGTEEAPALGLGDSDFDFDFEFPEMGADPEFQLRYGTVVSVQNIERGEFSETRVLADTDDGQVALSAGNIVLTPAGIGAEGLDELGAGDWVIAFSFFPVLVGESEPPVISADILVAGFENAHLARFHKDDEADDAIGEAIATLTSADGTLAIVPNEGTVIVYEDGAPFEGELHELDGRRLLAVYGAATRSIPAIAAPSHVVVFFEKAARFDAEAAARFERIAGTVTGVEPVEQLDRMVTREHRVFIETDGGPFMLAIDLDTVVLNPDGDRLESLAEGDEVVGFFVPQLFMAAIYPPMHRLDALVFGFGGAHLDRFHFDFEEEAEDAGNRLASADGTLAIRPDEDTVIIGENGEPVAGLDELDGRLLLVAYGESTRSIPAIAVPLHIAVLPDGLLPADIGGIGDSDSDFVDAPVFVNGAPIFDAFTLGEPGFPTHVPLMHVLAALEAPVRVEGNAVTVEGLNGTIVFEIGSNDFAVDGETITLELNSFRIDGTIYVPVPFFRVVFGMNNAYSLGDTVFIDNDERME